MEQFALHFNPMRKDMEAAIREYWTSVQSLDPSRYSANFAPDGTLEDPVGINTISGAREIAAFFRDGFQVLGVERATTTIKDMFPGSGPSTEVAVRWEITIYTKQAKQATVQGMGIFKFKPCQPGARLQLELVREFFDPLELMSQLR